MSSRAIGSTQQARHPVASASRVGAARSRKHENGWLTVFVDFDDIDLSDPAAVYVQITERRAVIDRLEEEVSALEHAYGAAMARRRGE